MKLPGLFRFEIRSRWKWIVHFSIIAVFAGLFASDLLRDDFRPFRGDSGQYLDLAGNLVRNACFARTKDGGQSFAADAKRPPLYPALLAAQMRFFPATHEKTSQQILAGDGREVWPIVYGQRVMLMLVSVSICGLVWKTTGMPLLGYGAMFFVSQLSNLRGNAEAITPEVLIALFLILISGLLYHAAKTGRLRYFLLLGPMLGLLTLTRAPYLYAPPFID